MDQLTGRVLAYQQTGSGEPQLFAEIMRRVYAYPARCFGLREDDCGEFLLYFYPRIELTLQRFEHRGKPFAAYLYATLKYQLRSYVAVRNRESIRRATADSPVICNTVFDVATLAERPPGYTALTPRAPSLQAEIDAVVAVLTAVPRSRSGSGANARRIVILAMKCCLKLNDADIRELAGLTGYNHDELQNQWIALRERMQLRLSRIAVLQERRSAAFFSMQYLRMRLRKASNPKSVDRLEKTLAIHRNRYERAQRRLEQVPLTPSNGEIATALGIPKGSVDSTMHYLRRVFAHETRAGGAEVATGARARG